MTGPAISQAQKSDQSKRVVCLCVHATKRAENKQLWHSAIEMGESVCALILSCPIRAEFRIVIMNKDACDAINCIA
jgi:hypothetical protein